MEGDGGCGDGGGGRDCCETVGGGGGGGGGGPISIGVEGEEEEDGEAAVEFRLLRFPSSLSFLV